MKKDNKIWDKMAKSFHCLSLNSKAHRDKYREIAKIIIDSKPGSVLDLGCGSGLLEMELIRMGYKGKITAVDSSAEMLKIAKSFCGDKVEFINADLNNDIRLANKYDLVVSINVMFFLSNKKAFLRNVLRLLSDNSPLFILVNPKPNNEANNWSFVKAHLSNASFFKKILISINEIINFPLYFKMIKGQLKISKMAKKGLVSFDAQEDIVSVVNSLGFMVKMTGDIHAGQNWFFVMGVKP